MTEEHRPLTLDEWWAGATSEAEKQQIREIAAIIDGIQQRQAARRSAAPKYPPLRLVTDDNDG